MSYLSTQVASLIDRLDKVREELYYPPITDWNEEYRYVSEKISRVPGPFSREIAPHMVEILERMHPDDPCKWITLMKSVQSTGTFHIELAMAYIIEHQLGNMGFYTAGLGLAKERSKTHIDPMIDDTTGLKYKVSPISTRNKRNTGDSTYLKEFVGGIKLAIHTYGSIAGMKSNTIPYMFLDELDEATQDIKGQGDVLSILDGRTLAVVGAKIMCVSTPTEMDTSLIYRTFLEGDQRYYYVPCPMCGEKEPLTFMEATADYGFTFKTEGKDSLRVIPETVGYVCKHCKKLWRESKKQKAMMAGEWRPTARAQDPKKHSYHLSGLMSPELMLGWQTVASKMAETDKGRNILKYKDATLNLKGWPWKRMKKQMKSDTFLKNNLRDYTLGNVPEHIYILYGAVDVQGDRLEYGVVGYGPGRGNALVDHKIFYGKTSDPDDPCWQRLDDYARTHKYKILRTEVLVSLVVIDAGWDPADKRGKRSKDWNDKHHTVYNFVGYRADLFVAIRGSGGIKGGGIVKPAKTQNPLCPNVYMLNSPLMKEILYREISLEDCRSAIVYPRWQIIGDVKTDIDSELIEQLLSERYQEVEPGVMGWKKTRARNEMLDLILYTRAAAYMENVTTWSSEYWNSYKNELVAT